MHAAHFKHVLFSRDGTLSFVKRREKQAPGHYLGTASVFFPKKTLIYSTKSRPRPLIYSISERHFQKKIAFFSAAGAFLSSVHYIDAAESIAH
jgi:hypothetical protein